MDKRINIILDLMCKEISRDNLIKLVESIDFDKKHVVSISEDHRINFCARFFPATKQIIVNYGKMLDYLDSFNEIIRIDMVSAREYEIKLICILTAYRIILHELYHAKQAYNVFYGDDSSAETELIRSIYNVDVDYFKRNKRKNYREKKIDDLTSYINSILVPYDEINLIERRAKIESYKQIREIISPIKYRYSDVYDELYMLELCKKINGYDKKIIPFFQLLDILNKNGLKYNFPYGVDNHADFINKIYEVTTEEERFELGLSVDIDTVENAYNEISSILCKKSSFI